MSNKENEFFSKKETEQFKTLFRKFCRNEINAGKCKEDDCEFCSVSSAYTDIFDTIEPDSVNKEE